jgi:hypothetical protein
VLLAAQKLDSLRNAPKPPAVAVRGNETA